MGTRHPWRHLGRCAQAPARSATAALRAIRAASVAMAAAAFYDLDGTLVRTNLVHAFAYNARNQQGLWRSVTNRLEFVDGKATGRLVPPVIAAATKASWIRTYAEKEGLSLSECYSYSDSMSDLPMLSVVGHPTAVNPDLRLRNTALQHDWPILDLR